MIAIKTVEDIKKVEHQIMGNLVKEGKARLCYFNILVEDMGDISNCFLSPATLLRESMQHFISVDDYSKMLMLLLSHPKVSNLEYDEDHNVVHAIFSCPYHDEGEGFLEP